MARAKKERDSGPRLPGIEADTGPQQEEAQEPDEENYCYIAMYVPGFYVGWRRFFFLDERGFLVARSDVDFGKKGAE
jgi:hypothetical protein